MKLVIFGLTVTSAWGNGHATTWRGLLKALAAQGHQVTFYERDVPYYANERDLPSPDFCDLVLYDDWSSVRQEARREVSEADVVLITSYCPDGLAASRLAIDTDGPVRVFYDIDTPITVESLLQHGVASATGAQYLTPDLIPEFDLYLSFTGGPMLDRLRSELGARYTAPLYCSVDTEIHQPVPANPAFRCSLGYLGTYSPDRQATLDQLLVEPARARPDASFWVVGSKYPGDLRWPTNVRVSWHLAPGEHAAFYCANRITLNVTRAAMVEAGYSPSVRLFEAASCGTPILSDWWPGLDEFFRPGEEILVARTSEEAMSALDLSDAELGRIATAARERTLAEHTCEVRARELIEACERARSRELQPSAV